MDEPEREPPEEQKPLTREDVLRLIEEHGGPRGLDLREANLQGARLSQANLQGADLSSANLQGANLRRAELQGATLAGANLQEADLCEANLQGARLWRSNLQGALLLAASLEEAHLEWANLEGANLAAANLQEARLDGAQLQGADLHAANLQGADLHAANLRRAHLADATLRDANLEGANWGDYVLSDEIEHDFRPAGRVYRTLKQWHTEAGMYDIAGQFFYREMEARRKAAQKERRRPYALGMYAVRFLYGYGERPERVIAWAAAVILGFALGHWLFGTVAGGAWDALYYSAVSFTALGYGAWAPEPQGWAGKFLGVGESLLGVFMMALFLVTFTRKMTR
jgi:hypothetical protein